MVARQFDRVKPYAAPSEANGRRWQVRGRLEPAVHAGLGLFGLVRRLMVNRSYFGLVEIFLVLIMVLSVLGRPNAQIVEVHFNSNSLYLTQGIKIISQEK